MSAVTSKGKEGGGGDERRKKKRDCRERKEDRLIPKFLHGRLQPRSLWAPWPLRPGLLTSREKRLSFSALDKLEI